MRPQNRPFVVEIKKTKRPGAPAAAGASAAQPPATWAEHFDQATALTDSAARKAAEALFAPPRPAAPAPQRPARTEDSPADPWRTEPSAPASSSPEAPGRKGRILVAIGSEAAAAEGSVREADVGGSPIDLRTPDERQPELLPAVRPASRLGRPRKVKAEASPPRPAATTRTEPLPAQRVPAAAVIVTPVRAEDPASIATPAAPARKGIWRRGGEALGRGEKWKRRLPQALR